MKYFIINSFKTLLFASFLISLWGCPSPKRTETVNKGRADSLKNAIDTMIQGAVKKKETYVASLKSMNIAQLSAQLTVESDRGLETFNSLAYAEAVARGKEGANQLSKELTIPTRSSLLAVIAIRKSDSTVYQKLGPSLRLSILLDALRTSRYYNDFGLPHIKWEEAARVIISEGQNVADSLKMLLQDTRPAPVWGSEDYVEYQRYMYRVCDYAWALLMTIRKQSFTIPTDPKERDKLIAAMK